MFSQVIARANSDNGCVEQIMRHVPPLHKKKKNPIPRTLGNLGRFDSSSETQGQMVGGEGMEGGGETGENLTISQE